MSAYELVGLNLNVFCALQNRHKTFCGLCFCFQYPQNAFYKPFLSRFHYLSNWLKDVYKK